MVKELRAKRSEKRQRKGCREQRSRRLSRPWRMETVTKEKVWRCYRLHAQATAWQDHVVQRGSTVLVNGPARCLSGGLSVSTLPNPAGGHLTGTVSLSTRLWQWLLGQMEVQVALCLFKSPQLDCVLSDSRPIIQTQVLRSCR